MRFGFDRGEPSQLRLGWIVIGVSSGSLFDRMAAFRAALVAAQERIEDLLDHKEKARLALLGRIIDEGE